MTDLWLANHRVTRWHTNPHLCRIGQTNADHCAGMAALAITIWPDTSAQLLRAILTHDAAESVIGDIPGPGKRDNPQLLMAYGETQDTVDAENGWVVDLHWSDLQRLTFLDRLEAYRFVRLHAPCELINADWRETYAWLREAAKAHNVDIDWMLK